MWSHYYLFPQNSCLIKCTVWMLLRLGTATQWFCSFSCIFSARLQPFFVFCRLHTTVSCKYWLFHQSVLHHRAPSCLGLGISEPCSEIEVHSHVRGGRNVWSSSISPCRCPAEAAQAVFAEVHALSWPCEWVGHQALGAGLETVVQDFLLLLSGHPFCTSMLISPSPFECYGSERLLGIELIC